MHGWTWSHYSGRLCDTQVVTKQSRFGRENIFHAITPPAASTLTQGNMDPCFHVVYFKFLPYHVGAKIDTCHTGQHFFHPFYPALMGLCELQPQFHSSLTIFLLPMTSTSHFCALN